MEGNRDSNVAWSMFQAGGWVVTLVYFIHSLLIAQRGVKLEKINQVIWKVRGGTHLTSTNVCQVSLLWQAPWFTTNPQSTGTALRVLRVQAHHLYSPRNSLQKQSLKNTWSVSPGQLWESKHRFPGFSWDKPNRLSELEPQNPPLKQIHQRMCMHLKH